MFCFVSLCCVVLFCVSSSSSSFIPFVQFLVVVNDMDLTSQPVEATDKVHSAASEENQPPLQPYVSMVDPFLVEALQNPRHRLTSNYLSLSF